MAAPNLKTRLHELIDNSRDEQLLENFYNALSWSTEKKDIVDELSASQRNELNESIAQYRRGETISHEEVLKMLRQWHSK
jgi:hypothetical protein